MLVCPSQDAVTAPQLIPTSRFGVARYSLSNFRQDLCEQVSTFCVTSDGMVMVRPHSGWFLRAILFGGISYHLAIAR